jgi:hypothetical protein
MNARLSLHHSGISEEDLQELTFALSRTINQETDLTAQLPEEAGGIETRGDIGIVGQIILAAVGGGGAVTALIPVLKAYIERTPKLHITIEQADRKVSIEAEHLRPGQLEEITEALRKLGGNG